jgi:hypothetical protein
MQDMSVCVCIRRSEGWVIGADEAVKAPTASSAAVSETAATPAPSTEAWRPSPLQIGNTRSTYMFDQSAPMVYICEAARLRMIAVAAWVCII